MKNTLSLLLAIAMLFSIGVYSCAEENEAEAQFLFEDVEIVKDKNGKYLLDFTAICNYPETPGLEYPAYFDISYALLDDEGVAFQSCGIQIADIAFGDRHKASAAMGYRLEKNYFSLDEVRAVKFVSIGVAANGIYETETIKGQPVFDLTEQVLMLGGGAAGQGEGTAETVVKSVYDLDSLSNEDLMALPGKIAQEQIERGLVKTAVIGAGTYEVGVDIPAGSYTFKGLTNSYTTVLVFYPGDEPRYTSTLQDTKHQINLFAMGSESGKIDLEEGESIYISGGDTEMKVFTGVEFH